MYRLIGTFLDHDIGPDIFLNGALELRMHPKSFSSKEEAIEFIKTSEVERIKEQFSDDTVTKEDIETEFSKDERQAYIDIIIDFKEPLGKSYIGKYVYAIVKE